MKSSLLVKRLWECRPNSPPELGGVAAPSRKCCEASFERRRRGGSQDIALRNHPARLVSRGFALSGSRSAPRLAAPPNLGGEFTPSAVGAFFVICLALLSL